MSWCSFLFWFVYRLILALLAHFNWAMALYTNCVYFWLWKSYDMLWFWMHLILCSCFPPLRRENYLIVWCNLIYRKLTNYPDYTFKQLYLALYGTNRSTHFTKRLMSIKEKKGVINIEKDENSSDDEDSSNQDEKDSNCQDEKDSNCQDEKDVTQEVDEDSQPLTVTSESSPLRPPRPSRHPEASTSAQVPEKPCEPEKTKTKKSAIALIKEVGLKEAIRRMRREEKQKDVPKTPQIDAKYRTLQNGLEVLWPDYTNQYDVHDKKKRDKREKRDRKMLRHRVLKELREQEREDQRIEKRRKRVTDAIELLLQLLRMVTSFAVLVGNIRKTFIPAQFSYLKPGQHAYDNVWLLNLFRMTTFMDVAMFWFSATYVSCLQWKLCFRLGCKYFILWTTLLLSIAIGLMIIPMSIVIDSCDASWCRFEQNSTFAKYQPGW